MSRLVTTSATINGVDDETFGSNEFGHAEFTRETVLGDAQPQNVMRMQCRWGGECRVELDLTGQILNNEDVRISSVAKKNGIMDAQDDVDDPVGLITKPEKSLHNPNNPTLTAGMTFLG